MDGKVEGTVYLICTVVDVLYGSCYAIDLQSLNCVVQGTQGDVADGIGVAGYGGHNNRGAVGDLSGLGDGIVAVSVLNAEELYEGAAGTRPPSRVTTEMGLPAVLLSAVELFSLLLQPDRAPTARAAHIKIAANFFILCYFLSAVFV